LLVEGSELLNLEFVICLIELVLLSCRVALGGDGIDPLFIGLLHLQLALLESLLPDLFVLRKLPELLDLSLKGLLGLDEDV